MLLALLMTAMLAVIVMILVILILADRIHWSDLDRFRLRDRGGIAAADGCTGRAADGCSQYRAVLAPCVVTDCSACGTANCSADDSAAIRGMGIYTGGKEQGCG